MNYLFLEGNKRLIILFHAYTGTQADVRLLGTVLNKLGYSVCMPLFSGHGTKDMRHILKETPDIWAKESEALLDEMIQKKGYQQVAVFGLSLGGMMAMYLLTSQRKELIGGGTFNSPIPLSDTERVEKAFKQFSDKLYDEKLGDRATYDLQIEKGAKEQLEAICIFTQAVFEKLLAISVPIYIAQSGQDELIDSKTGALLKQALPFAPVNLHYFEEGKHAITVGNQRHELNETVCAFIESLDWEV